MKYYIVVEQTDDGWQSVSKYPMSTEDDAIHAFLSSRSGLFFAALSDDAETGKKQINLARELMAGKYTAVECDLVFEMPD